MEKETERENRKETEFRVGPAMIGGAKHQVSKQRCARPHPGGG